MSEPGAITVSLAGDAASREAVYRFRYDVYVREMGKIRLREADHARGWLCDPDDERARLYAAHDEDGQVVGTLRVLNSGDRRPERISQIPTFDRFAPFRPETMSFSGRLMVAPGLRGTFALNVLVGKAYADALETEAQFDFCTCSPGLVDLYEHLGYRRFSGNVVDPVIGYQVPLVLVLRDVEHLRMVRSPFLRILRSHPSAGDGGPVAAWLRETFPARSVVRAWVDHEEAYWSFLAERVRASAAGTATILRELSEDEQRRLFRSGTVLDAAAGDYIISHGTVGKEMFVVLSGLCEVRLPGQATALAVLDTGQVFGEIAFISDALRSADVVALTDARILVLSQTYLNKLMKAAPELASKLLFNLSRTLCERLVTSNRARADGQTAGQVG